MSQNHGIRTAIPKDSTQFNAQNVYESDFQCVAMSFTRAVIGVQVLIYHFMWCWKVHSHSVTNDGKNVK